MHLLALDIGMKKTGAAFGDTKSGILMALQTIRHESTSELIKKIEEITREKKVDALLVGLPLLPSGEEGKQASLIRETAEEIERRTGISVEYIDERYTTKNMPKAPKTDPDAKAACSLLHVKMDRKNAIDM